MQKHTNYQTLIGLSDFFSCYSLLFCFISSVAENIAQKKAKVLNENCGKTKRYF